MHELQQLHRELDVADTTGAELHVVGVGRFAPRRSCSLVPRPVCFIVPNARDALLRDVIRIDERARLLNECLAGRTGTGEMARLDEGLVLPRFRPSPVVLEVTRPAIALVPRYDLRVGGSYRR